MYTITRNKTSQNGTFGTWTDEDGSRLAFTVERPKSGVHPCIAPGIYTFNAFISPTKGDVWLRDDDAAHDGRSMIEIHPANLSSQLLGCIAPGDAIGEVGGIPAVLNSKVTFKMLKSELPKSFQLHIVEEFI